jgi:hypothetical protein
MSDFVYCKDDGSLNYGIEVVSHPMTWAWIQTNKEKIHALLVFLNGKNCSSWDTGSCGLHVHVSRAALNRATIERMAKFIYENADFTLKISRRKGLSALNHWALINVGSDLEILAKGRSAGNRYVALNMENAGTIEFRIFKGTLKPSGVFQALEFCHACIAFAQDTSLELTPQSFISFVDSHLDDYPLLFDFLHDDRVDAREKARIERQEKRRAERQAAREAEALTPTISWAEAARRAEAAREAEAARRAEAGVEF